MHTIKKLENSDVNTAHKIRSIFQVSYAIEAQLLDLTYFPPLERSLDSFLNSDTDFFGYWKNQVLVGVIEIEENKDSIDIDSLVVDPRFFRQGIAGELIKFIFNSFDSKLFVVETAVENMPAIELYQKFDFKEIKQWNTKEGIRKIRFEKKII